jgi:DNA-binding MarR family transcriptional regulator
MTEPGPDEVLDNLVQVSFTVMALLSRAAAAHDLSLTQLRAMAELAEYLGLDRSSVTGLIDRAVKRGLVRREASDDDGRAVRVGLTEQAHRLAGELGAEIAQLLAPLTRDLTPAERNRLGVLLGRMLPGEPAG